MSASLKYIAGGAVFGGVGRFFLSGDYTWLNAARHVGYSMFAGAGGSVGLWLYEPAATAPELAQAGMVACGAIVLGRAFDVVLTGKVKAKIGPVEIEAKGK